MSDQQQREAIVAAHLALGAAGQSDMIWGHASVRDDQDRGVWMKAAGWGFEEVTEERVVLVSPGGEVLDGTGHRHIEYPIHTAVMASRPDVGAVVHTHSPAACSFASLDSPLRALSHDAVPFVAPDIPRFTDTGNLIRTEALGVALAEAIGDAAGALVPAHGLVTVGPDLATAVMRAVLLDRACRTQLQAMAAGDLSRWSDDDEVRAKQEQVWSSDQYHSGYAYLIRSAT